MIEEIIYTSAERGLKSGSRGFCTVVSTSGMGLNLAERLESMSGYRHAFPLNDPRAGQNPVNHAHVMFRLAGRKLNALSRVANAGQDYTGRSNKLAHHIVISNTANLSAGPARLLADPNIMVSQWDGKVRNIPPRKIVSPKLPEFVNLQRWESLTGDGGWAGKVAEMLVQDSAPVSMVFRPGTDTLGLVQEVLDLLPPAQRWNITFSTYFRRLLPGTECQLRFVLNDTPEATVLRNDARARVIDLTKKLPMATGGALVEIARLGKISHAVPVSSQQGKTAQPIPPGIPASNQPQQSMSTPESEEEIAELNAEPETYALICEANPDGPRPSRCHHHVSARMITVSPGRNLEEKKQNAIAGLSTSS